MSRMRIEKLVGGEWVRYPDGGGDGLTPSVGKTRGCTANADFSSINLGDGSVQATADLLANKHNLPHRVRDLDTSAIIYFVGDDGDNPGVLVTSQDGRMYRT